MSNYNFNEALKVGRTPNIVKLFPNSKALIVSGKFIDYAMLQKKNAMAIAANGRNLLVIKGVLKAAQKCNSALMIEIAKSEGNYCPVNFWNMARIVDALMNELDITIPVAIHADHYVLKSQKDIEFAKKEIPSIFNAGITSIAIDASHLPDDENAISNIDLSPHIPSWAGYETEIGEIKGDLGLSTPEEALFLIQALNANNIFPDWIALNNGTTHGIESKEAAGVQVALTAKIHDAISKYKVSGAQHGTSGNDYKRLQEIVQKTNTTKANVATAFQMLAWGVDVNEYGNAIFDASGNFVKLKDNGLEDELWNEMLEYAEKNDIKGNDFKKLNLVFERRILTQDEKIQQRMVNSVTDFACKLLDVFNAKDTADIVIDKILSQSSYDLGAKVGRIENPDDWTTEKIRQKAKALG